ncbi:MAG: hypothetical protein PHR97_06490 [Bacteroidales bacterium]|nr:hypothetical protein [Bacteroidales bacterium]
MRTLKNIIVFLAVFYSTIVFNAGPLHACTSAIITGKVTANGRPLLWKHRDTGQEQNRIEFFNKGKYAFIALVDSPDKDGVAWTGTNAAGFSIMNTASYNLKDDDVKEMDKEGVLMYKALEICGSLPDFEKMLDTLSKPMGVEANFGVIDAFGGAAYYEVNNHSWVKTDVNDPRVAPGGYLIYTNFSYSGRINEGMGYIRYQTATEIFGQKAVTGQFTPQWIFNNLSRSFYHSLLGYDLCDPEFSPENGRGWFIDQDFIPRKSSSCSIVIEGVKNGDDPLKTTMWTVLGYPPAGVCIPVWVQMGEKQPGLLVKRKQSDNSILCEWAVGLKNRTFPIKRGNGSRYMHFTQIYNTTGKGYMQQLRVLEDELFKIYDRTLSRLENEGLTGKKIATKEIEEMYKEISLHICEVYDRL